MKNKYSINELTTKVRLKKLGDYMKKNIFKDKGKFLCSCYKECKRSHNGLFYKGHLHHIGKKYDLKMNSIPIRIMVVGQELADRKNYITLDDHYIGGIESKEDYTYNERNPHMKGTTNVLRLLLRIGLGTDADSEFLTFSNGKSSHIFDVVSLVNYLLCSALKEGKGKAGYSTSVMKNNCQEHFRKVLDILEPNIIIVQSRGFWKWIEKSFDNIKPISSKYPLYQAEINGSKVYVASFSHPAARNKLNWGRDDHTEYLLNTVKPTVNCILKKLGL